MSYIATLQTIPMEFREQINQKILAVVAMNGHPHLSRADIFNGFTGKGGLHGLSRSDFASFHAFSEAKRELEWGQFFSPDPIVKRITDLLQLDSRDLVADLTCGHGAFCNHAPLEENFYGYDLDQDALRVARFLYPKAQWHHQDLTFFDSKTLKFSVVVGNPPFSFRMAEKPSEYVYCEKAHSCLIPGGLLALITPVSFLMDAYSTQRIRANMQDRFLFIGQLNLGSCFPDANIETKVSFWAKRAKSDSPIPFQSEFTEEDELFRRISQTRKAMKLSRTRSFQSKVNNQVSRCQGLSRWSENDQFDFMTRKLLY